jgi:hypothetical protein
MEWKTEYGTPEGCHIVDFENSVKCLCFIGADTISFGDSFIDTDPGTENNDEIEEEPNTPTI